MKKAFTRGEKLLLASPLLFLIFAGAAWQWRKTAPVTLDLPESVVVRALEFSPDGGRLVAFTERDKNLGNIGRVYDLETHSKICDLTQLPILNAGFSAPHRTYNRPAWSNDGNRITASSGVRTTSGLRNRITIWHAGSGAVAANWPSALPENNETGEALRFSPDDETLIGEGIPPARYNASTGERLNHPDMSLWPYESFQLNEKLGLFADYGGVTDFKTKRRVWKLNIGGEAIFKWGGDILCIAETISDVTTNGNNGQNRIVLWNGKTRRTLPAPPVVSGAYVGYFSFHPDGRTLVYSLSKYDMLAVEAQEPKFEIITYDYRANRVLWRAMLEGGMPEVAWSPDGKWLTSIGGIGGEKYEIYELSIFDKSGKLRLKRELGSTITSWSRDSKQLVFILSEQTGKVLARRLEVHRFAE